MTTFQDLLREIKGVSVGRLGVGSVLLEEIPKGRRTQAPLPYIYGGSELARHLEGKTIKTVEVVGGWIYLTTTDGLKLEIAAEYGASLSLTMEKQ